MPVRITVPPGTSVVLPLKYSIVAGTSKIVSDCGPVLYPLSIKDFLYVVIACGGGKMGTQSGDAYVADALPESAKLRGGQPSG